MTALPMRNNPFALPQMQQPNLGPQISLPPQQKPKGMFAGGWGDAIAAALGGYAAGMGNPIGGHVVQSLHQKKMQQQQQQQAEEQYNRKQQDEQAWWYQQQAYKQANEKPDQTAFAKDLIAAGIDPNSDQGRALYQRYVENKANPFTQMVRTNPDGSEVREWMRPPTVPTAPVGRLIPLDDDEGGPTPQASGNFPF